MPSRIPATKIKAHGQRRLEVKIAQQYCRGCAFGDKAKIGELFLGSAASQLRMKSRNRANSGIRPGLRSWKRQAAKCILPWAPIILALAPCLGSDVHGDHRAKSPQRGQGRQNQCPRRKSRRRSCPLRSKCLRRAVGAFFGDKRVKIHDQSSLNTEIFGNFRQIPPCLPCSGSELPSLFRISKNSQMNNGRLVPESLLPDCRPQAVCCSSGL